MTSHNLLFNVSSSPHSFHPLLFSRFCPNQIPLPLKSVRILHDSLLKTCLSIWSYNLASFILSQLFVVSYEITGGTVAKKLPANAGDARDEGSVPGSGRLPGEGNGNPLQFFSFLERKVCFFSDAGIWGGRVADICPKAN